MGGSFGASVTLLIGCLIICCCWCCVDVSGCVEEERRALLDIKHSLHSVGYDPIMLEDWVVGGGDCCNWTGVECDALSYPYRAVSNIDLSFVRLGFSQKWYPNASLFGQFKELKKLYLSYNGIAGWVNPQDIWHLQKVQQLNLRGNHLNDESLARLIVPWIHNLTSLFELYLGGNSLKEIRWISNITSLSSLDLSNTQIKDFSGLWRLPHIQELYLGSNELTEVSWLSNLTSLTTLFLDDNTLNDSSIIKDLCQLQDLQDLDLSKNSMKGNIDTCLKSLYSLESLDLSSNQLDGAFSFSTFANLSNISLIDLSNNDRLEVETESPSWVPSFQLEHLFLSNCVLNKHSGRRVPSFLSTQNALTDIDLSHSSIIVSNLSELINNVTRILYLGGNTFHGPFLQDNKNSSSSLEILDLSDSNICGTLPPNFTIFFTKLVLFNMSGNALHGTIPLSLGVHPSLVYLDLSRNNFTGEIPQSIMKNQNLIYLDLANNNLIGKISFRNCSMPRLQYFNLYDNHLTGSIPISLFNSSNIMFLDIRKNFFSGNIHSSLFTLHNAIILLLSENNFEGPVPTQVCHMQNLHILDLSNNYLSGTIPNCLKNISSWIIDSLIDYPMLMVVPYRFFYISTNTVVTNLTTKGRCDSYMGTPLSLMTELDLSKNQFSGPLPFQMGYLSALHSLNLSNNHLTGPIPNSFQNLENIESLDLSNNYLSGEISSQLVKLHLLSVFRVAYNNLSGIIPYKDQFCTFNKSSFEGNPGLSEVLIEKNCWSMHETSQTYHDSSHNSNGDQEDTSKAIDNDVIFYSFIAASFAIGFWGVIAVLAFNKNGRIKFFMAADYFLYACIDV